MKTTAMSVLLYFLSVLVKVHSQMVPFLTFMGNNLPNHSYVDLTLVGNDGDGSDSVQCHTDLSTCCSRFEGDDRGDWYGPSQDRLLFPFMRGADIVEERTAQRVDLRRRNNGSTSGIYRCDIETVAVTGGNSQETVYVGLYSSGGWVE